MTLLNTDEAAEILRVKRQTLEAWRIRRQGPPFILVGRLARYDADALAAWLRSRTKTAASEYAP